MVETQDLASLHICIQPRIFRIRLPIQWILYNILTNMIQRFFVTKNNLPDPQVPHNQNLYNLFNGPSFSRDIYLKRKNSIQELKCQVSNENY
jgi:hypothetical protein